jgi:hypothetical protein
MLDSSNTLKSNIGSRNLIFLNEIKVEEIKTNVDFKSIKNRYQNNFIIEKNKKLLNAELTEKEALYKKYLKKFGSESSKTIII